MASPLGGIGTLRNQFPTVQQRQREQQDPGVITSTVAGFLEGVFEPLGIIPGIGGTGGLLEDLDRAQGHGIIPKIGQGAGYLAGLLIPGTAAVKLAGFGAARLGLTGTALVAARGAGAGALLSAGLEADSLEERFGKAIAGAALGGVGDVALGKLLSGLVRTGSTGNTVRARDLTSMLDENFDPRATTTLKRAFANDIRPGEVVALTNLGAESGAIAGVLDGLEGVQHRVIDTPLGLKGQRKAILLGSDVPEEAVTSLQKNGFFPGQRAMFGQDEWEVVARNSSNGALTLQRGSQRATVGGENLRGLTMLPYGDFRSVAVAPEAPSLYRAFSKEHGAIPEVGFENAFDDFLTKNPIEVGKVPAVRDFFQRRTIEAVKDMDPDMASRLKRYQEGARKIGQGSLSPHVSPTFAALGRQAMAKGYFIDFDVDKAAGKIVHRVQDATTGESQTFLLESEVRALIEESAREAPGLAERVIAMSPLPFEGLQIPGGRTTSFAHSTLGHHILPSADVSAFNVALGQRAAGAIAPFLQYTKRIDDLFFNQTGQRLGISTQVSELAQVRKAVDTDMLPLMRGIRKSHGSAARPKVAPERWGAVRTALETGLTDGLSGKEQLAHRQLGQVWDDFFDILRDRGAVRVTGQDFLRDYMPALLRLDRDSLVPGLRALLKEDVDEGLLALLDKVNPDGISFAFRDNPYSTALTFMRRAFTEQHGRTTIDSMMTMRESLLRTANTVRGPGGLPQASSGGGVEYVTRLYDEYLKVALGDTPEMHAAARQTFGKVMDQIGIPIAENDLNRMTSLLLSLNYGAFMAFRPALAMRNLTQSLVTTWAVNDSRSFLYGVRKSLTKEGKEAARKAGAFVSRDAAQPVGDAVLISQLAASADPAAGAGLKVAATAADFGQRGLAWYNNADAWNRTVAFHTGQERARRALVRWRKAMVATIGEAPGSPSRQALRKRFTNEAGLDWHGGEVTRTFFDQLDNSADSQGALNYLGTQMADNTQWIYSSVAGPLAITKGPWRRVLGQFGTWPSWYVDFFRNGLTRGSVRDRTSFALKSAGLHASFGGLGLHAWSPMSSFTYTGGPVAEFGKDGMMIMAGGPERSLALSRYGLIDSQEEGLQFRDATDGRPSGESLLFAGTLGNLVPGFVAARNVRDAGNAPDPVSALLRASGFPRDAAAKALGHTWPGVRP